jgi:hypothetical protein
MTSSEKCSRFTPLIPGGNVLRGVLPGMALVVMPISVAEFLYDGLYTTEPFRECNVAP